MDQFENIENLAEHVKEYVNTKISVVKLNIAEKTARLIAWMVVRLLLFFILLFLILFLSFSAAYAIGGALGKLSLGFLVIAGFYLLLGLFLVLAKEKLLRIPLMNLFIRQMFSDENDEGDEKN